MFRFERTFFLNADVFCLFVGKLREVYADALEVDEPTLFARHGLTAPVSVAANLPYNVGTALLIKWLTAPSWPSWFDSLTLMFQREVAERTLAQRQALLALSQQRTQAEALQHASAIG